MPGRCQQDYPLDLFRTPKYGNPPPNKFRHTIGTRWHGFIVLRQTLMILVVNSQCPPPPPVCGWAPRPVLIFRLALLKSPPLMSISPFSPASMRLFLQGGHPPFSCFVEGTKNQTPIALFLGWPFLCLHFADDPQSRFTRVYRFRV